MRKTTKNSCFLLFIFVTLLSLYYQICYGKWSRKIKD